MVDSRQPIALAREVMNGNRDGLEGDTENKN